MTVRGARWGLSGWVGLGVAVVAAALLVGAGVVLASGGSIAVALGVAPSASPAPVAEPAAGQTVTVHGVRSVPIVPGQPLRLQIPSIGLNVSVGSMSIRPGEDVDPPTPGSAYWLRNYGTVGPGSDNTAYIAGHTCRGAGCTSAFSRLLDVPQSATTVHAGDQVVVTTREGSYGYTITDTQLYLKTSIAQQAEMWKKVPGRLVLVTCFQYRGGTSSQQNFVVYAQANAG